MAEQTPLYMDISNAYSGDELGLPWRDILGEGIIAAGDLAVTAGAGNSVNIAAGACFVLGDTTPARQPNYRCYNDAVVNKGITPDPANPRRVLVVAQIVDEAFAGTGRLWRIDTIHGTPAAAPVVPATPASAIPLANVLVPAAAASSATYTITDLRARATIGAGGALLPSSSALPAAHVYSTVDTSVATGTFTVIPFANERYDYGGFHDNAVNNTRLTVPEDGIYRVGGGFRWDTTAPTNGAMIIRHNGADVTSQPNSSIGWRETLTIDWAALTGEYFELFAYHESGAARTVDGAGSVRADPVFWISKVRSIP